MQELENQTSDNINLEPERPDKPKRHMPERTCLVSRETGSKEEMIRFVLSPDNEVTPDLKEKLSGRGVWVTAKRSFIEKAFQKKLFARGFKQPVKVHENLVQSIEQLLLCDVRQGLSLANKAGAVVEGFFKVEKAIGEKKLKILLHAQEAAEDGQRKLANAIKKMYEDQARHVMVIQKIEGADLDQALGRSHIMHAGLLNHKGSDAFLLRWRRLCTYQEQEKSGISVFEDMNFENKT